MHNDAISGSSAALRGSLRESGAINEMVHLQKPQRREVCEALVRALAGDGQG